MTSLRIVCLSLHLMTMLIDNVLIFTILTILVTTITTILSPISTLTGLNDLTIQIVVISLPLAILISFIKVPDLP